MSARLEDADAQTQRMNFEESNELGRRQQELWGDMARLRELAGHV